MSADNGIYICSFPTSETLDLSGMTAHFENCPCTEGYPIDACRCLEFRVVHAQAIDNIFWDPTQNEFDCRSIFKNGVIPPEGFTFEYGNPKSIVDYFQRADVQFSEGDAWKKAVELFKETIADFGICEYGINSFYMTKPFSWYEKEAARQPKYEWED